LSESLGGARVVLLEARRESELASLVRRHGGDPVCVPALREVETECADSAARAIDAAGRTGAVVVLATGVGLARFLAVAETAGRRGELHDALGRATVVCRCPKPVAVLKQEGLVAHVRAPAPHTTRELLATLDAIDVRDRDFVFVHDGGGVRTVPEWALQRGARVSEVQPYAWSLPEDLTALEGVVTRLVAGDFTAILFTTQIQARHLVSVAEAMGSKEPLVDALRTRVVVGAVGPTTAATLTDLGVPPHVVPAQGSMGALVVALARRLAQ
jgi:uroporphyrinogen-III synthase